MRREGIFPFLGHIEKQEMKTRRGVAKSNACGKLTKDQEVLGTVRD